MNKKNCKINFVNIKKKGKKRYLKITVTNLNNRSLIDYISI